MEVKLLKVIERHQILMLALHKQISQEKQLRSLVCHYHTKLLMRRKDPTDLTLLLLSL